MTVHYRGKLDDLARLEELEDRLVEVAIAAGGYARILRSAAGTDPSRVVRGAILELDGLETASFLVAPDGWLVPLVEIDDAAEGRTRGPRWLSVKTQHGPLEGHVVLVETLAKLEGRFVSNLEVADEGDYWERRDLVRLLRRRGERATSERCAGIARVIEKVHRAFALDDAPGPWDTGGSWETFAGVLDELGLTDLPDADDDEGLPFVGELPPEEHEHPLVARVTALGMRLFGVARSAVPGDALDAAARGAAELMGGTVQALSELEDPLEGSRLFQLGRALRGAADADLGIRAARAAGLLDEWTARQLRAEFDAIGRELQVVLRVVRERLS